jgi:hypothetical protein
MTVSNKPWQQFGSESYTPGQWKSACLVDRGVGDASFKGRYAVPVREPNGDVNRHAVAEAAKMGAAFTGLTDQQRRTAARGLVKIMVDDLGQQPTEQLLAAAGLAAATRSAEDADTAGGQYRQFRSGLHVRSGGDGRTIEGIVVPYGQPVRIDSQLVEQFAVGAFRHQMRAANRVKLGREHIMLGGELIGAGQQMEDRPEGLWMAMRVATTRTGDDTLALVDSGALDELSIMFRERQNRKLGGGVIERVKADLIEVAIVLEGAYGRLATVTGIRSAADGGDPAGDESGAIPDTELRRRAEKYLADGGLPSVDDPNVRLRAIRLGMPT